MTTTHTLSTFKRFETTTAAFDYAEAAGFETLPSRNGRDGQATTSSKYFELASDANGFYWRAG